MRGTCTGGIGGTGAAGAAAPAANTPAAGALGLEALAAKLVLINNDTFHIVNRQRQRLTFQWK